MSVLVLLAIIFGTCALISMVLIPYTWFRARRLERDGITAMGTVSKMEENTDDNGFTVTIDFFVDGVRHRCESPTRRDGYRVDESVQVRFLRERPDDAVVDTRKRIYANTILSAVLSVSFTLSTITMLVLRVLLGGE